MAPPCMLGRLEDYDAVRRGAALLFGATMLALIRAVAGLQLGAATHSQTSRAPRPLPGSGRSFT